MIIKLLNLTPRDALGIKCGSDIFWPIFHFMKRLNFYFLKSKNFDLLRFVRIIELFKFFSKPIFLRKFFDCKMTWAEDALHLKVWKIIFERSFERAPWISESKKRHFSDRTEKWGYKLPILWQKMSHKHVIRIWYLNSYFFAKFG